MQNWHQMLEVAQLTEQERQHAALMAAERRRRRREALSTRSGRLIRLVIHRG